MTKPLFRWVVPPDGRQRSAKELVDHCSNIQTLFFDLRERRLNVRESKELIEAVAEIMAENGIQVVAPQDFANLFK
jgi:hypothetical protein